MRLSDHYYTRWSSHLHGILPNDLFTSIRLFAAFSTIDWWNTKGWKAQILFPTTNFGVTPARLRTMRCDIPSLSARIFGATLMCVIPCACWPFALENERMHSDSVRFHDWLLLLIDWGLHCCAIKVGTNGSRRLSMSFVESGIVDARGVLSDTFIFMLLATAISTGVYDSLISLNNSSPTANSAFSAYSLALFTPLFGKLLLTFLSHDAGLRCDNPTLSRRLATTTATSQHSNHEVHYYFPPMLGWRFERASSLTSPPSSRLWSGYLVFLQNDICRNSHADFARHSSSRLIINNWGGVCHFQCVIRLPDIQRPVERLIHDVFPLIRFCYGDELTATTSFWNIWSQLSVLTTQSNLTWQTAEEALRKTLSDLPSMWAPFETNCTHCLPNR